MIGEESLKQVETLHRMKTDGVISSEEFEKAKQKVLFGSASGSLSPALQMPAEEDPFGWMTLPLRRFADFEGRSGRREFWSFFFLYAILLLGATFILYLDMGADESPGPIGLVIGGAAAITGIGFIVPFVAVQVRRFHDQDKPGWFALLNLIPYVGIIIVLSLMLIEGAQEDNRFGSPPGRGS